MARPRAKELTERELEVMHVFWRRGASNVNEVRDDLSSDGRDLAYTTVATLVRILTEKGFLEQVNDERPFVYQPVRSFQDVTDGLIGDFINRVFGGSREDLLVRLFDRTRLSTSERALLEDLLREKSQ
jgi:predicted transcriptional regulator